MSSYTRFKAQTPFPTARIRELPSGKGVCFGIKAIARRKRLKFSR